MTSLHTLYRPQDWDEVVGQAPAVKALRSLIDQGEISSDAFLLCGPSGVGKTTLARIGAHKLGCAAKNIIEIDGATYTGIDDMRRVQDLLMHKPFGKDKGRSIILDEAHRLSRQAWDSLLKSIEEPPEHVFWFLCTTELGKVPATIQTRCTKVVLKEVKDDDLRELINWVCKSEKIRLADGVEGIIIKEAGGSPRQALVNLATVRECKGRKEAASVLQSALEGDASLELCRYVSNGNGSWPKAMSILKKLEDDNPESVRINVMNYLARCLEEAKGDREACHFLQMMESFAKPFHQSEGKAPLYLAVGRVLYSQQGTEED